MTEHKERAELFGTACLWLATYWWLVAHFRLWTVGIIAFLAAMLLNAIHLLLRASK